MKVSKDTIKVIALLKKHNVSANDLIGLLMSALEIEIENVCAGEDYLNENRDQAILGELDCLWAELHANDKKARITNRIEKLNQ